VGWGAGRGQRGLPARPVGGNRDRRAGGRASRLRPRQSPAPPGVFCLDQPGASNESCAESRALAVARSSRARFTSRSFGICEYFVRCRAIPPGIRRSSRWRWRHTRRRRAARADERDNNGGAVVHLEAGVHRARVRLVIAKTLFREVHAGQKGVLIVKLPHGHLPPRRCCRAERSLVDPLSSERVHGERSSRLPIITKLAPEFREAGAIVAGRHSTRRRRCRLRRTTCHYAKGRKPW